MFDYIKNPTITMKIFINVSFLDPSLPNVYLPLGRATSLTDSMGYFFTQYAILITQYVSSTLFPLTPFVITVAPFVIPVSPFVIPAHAEGPRKGAGISNSFILSISRQNPYNIFILIV